MQIVYNYLHIKNKINKIRQDILFNKKCLQNNVIPSYVKIKMSKNSQAAKKTERNAKKSRIINEIRHLYMKKCKLNKKLYLIHLEILNEFHNTAIESIFRYINKITSHKIRKIINIHNKKIQKLMKSQQTNEEIITTCSHTFYPRVINHTNIEFTAAEQDVLNKGLKYKVTSFKKPNIIQELTNAEAALSVIKNNKIRNETHININNEFKKTLSNPQKKQKN